MHSSEPSSARTPHARDLRRKASDLAHRILHWADRRVPFGIRSLVGVAFMIGGVFWFLPILGLWMLPLGVALIALDIPWTRHRIRDWMAAHEAKRRARAARRQPTSCR